MNTRGKKSQGRCPDFSLGCGCLQKRVNIVDLRPLSLESFAYRVGWQLETRLVNGSSH